MAFNLATKSKEDIPPELEESTKTLYSEHRKQKMQDKLMEKVKEAVEQQTFAKCFVILFRRVFAACSNFQQKFSLGLNKRRGDQDEAQGREGTRMLF